jgi:Uma2 family endonuclease
MATVHLPAAPWKNGYPTSDGKPMAETDWHRDLMARLIQILAAYYAGQNRVYVSGNLLVFYVPGDKRRHVSPDVFVVKGVANHQRPNYLVWEERKGPSLVIELTSSSTRREDVETKYRLYQDVLQVREYFLFDPRADYLNPPLQGYRLRRGLYHPIRAGAGRLPSQVLGLHLEGHGEDLRLYDPAEEQWLPTPTESVKQEQAARRQAEDLAERERAARRQAEAEVERLRRELEQLRRDAGQGPA